MYPFERFTNEAKAVLTLAQKEAEQSRSSYIGTEHLVIGLIRQEGLGGQTLLNLGQSVDGLRKTMQEVIRKGGETQIVQQIIPTSRVKTVIEMAFEEARRQASSHVGTDHMLLAVMLEGEGIGASMLASRGLTVDMVRSEIDRLEAAGVSEQVGQSGWVRPRHEQFKVADADGQLIEVDLGFPSEYSDEQAQAVIDRIMKAFRGR